MCVTPTNIVEVFNTWPGCIGLLKVNWGPKSSFAKRNCFLLPLLYRRKTFQKKSNPILNRSWVSEYFSVLLKATSILDCRLQCRKFWKQKYPWWRWNYSEGIESTSNIPMDQLYNTNRHF
jgi:hypothetical protein